MEGMSSIRICVENTDGALMMVWLGSGLITNTDARKSSDTLKRQYVDVTDKYCLTEVCK